MLLLLVGIIFFYFTFKGFKQTRNFYQNAIIVPGIVVGSQQKEDGESLSVKKDSSHIRRKKLYTAIVRYEFEGSLREITGTSYSSINPKIGKLVLVAVNAQNTQEAKVKESFWPFYMTMGLLGAIICFGFIRFVGELSAFFNFISNIL